MTQGHARLWPRLDGVEHSEFENEAESARTRMCANFGNLGFVQGLPI
jgi:hypothetical protein